MENHMADVAIIGAGVSGLAAAWSLSQSGTRSVVFEKSRGLSGRAATRRKNGHHYDHGANFFRLDDPVVANLLQIQLGGEGLVEIPGDVHTFDCRGKISPGDPAQNAIAKWTYHDGISTLGKQLLNASPLATVIRETRITKIGNDGSLWWAEDQHGQRHGPWKNLLITIPPPQAAELLSNSGVQLDMAARLADIPYHPQFSFILGYQQPPCPTRDFHALVNTDGKHPLAWLSFEDDKPGHVTGGASVMVAQMSPAWTAGHYENPPETLIREVAEIAATLLESNLPHPDWWDSQRWRYAHPVQGRQPTIESMRMMEKQGLHFAGDGLIGKGRIPLAIQTGLEAADRILASR